MPPHQPIELSNRDVARMTGLSPSSVGNYINDSYDPNEDRMKFPSEEAIEKLAKALRLDYREGLRARFWRDADHPVPDSPIKPESDARIPAALRAIAAQLEATVPPTEPPVDADPLAPIGVELDPGPYIEAMDQIARTGAGIGLGRWSRHPTVDGGLEKAFEGVGPIRVFRVVGDCMEPILRDGDEIILTAPETVESGDIVTATVDVVNVTCKRIYIPGDGQPSYLTPINGEGTIPEDRFQVSGVVRRVYESIESRLRRERGPEKPHSDAAIAGEKEGEDG